MAEERLLLSTSFTPYYLAFRREDSFTEESERVSSKSEKNRGGELDEYT